MASNNDNSPLNEADRPRRGSITSQTFNNLFGRSNSTAGTPAFPGPITTAAAENHRRRMSISGVGLSASSPYQPTTFGFGHRRSSVSTAGSDSINESAIEDDDGPGVSQPTTPFARRMSFGAQALRSVRNANGSPGSTGRSPNCTTSPNLPTIPQRGGGRSPPNLQASTQSMPRTASDFPSARPAEGGGFNWSEQLRSRAESSVAQQRPLFSSSPPNKTNQMHHERTKSVSEMQSPPATIPSAPPAKPERKKPDAFQERILKGDFYMD